MCALGDFLVLSASVLRQIARAIFLITEAEKASKTHPKSSHDKFKTVSKIYMPDELQSCVIVGVQEQASPLHLDNTWYLMHCRRS